MPAILPAIFGFATAFMAWVAFTTDPAFDTSWFNDMLGLSDTEAAITTAFFMAGLFIGGVAAYCYDLEKDMKRLSERYDMLADKVYGRDSHRD